ncbi:hypothetical protein SUGI_0256600 [Cryptomeria japonica]|nr:hypothetical protein SUGI_0256600 [Cryptomeria japonica]
MEDVKSIVSLFVAEVDGVYIVLGVFDGHGRFQATLHYKERIHEPFYVRAEEVTESSDFKKHHLPLACIQKIMKADEDVHMISAEAPFVFAKACEDHQSKSDDCFAHVLMTDLLKKLDCIQTNDKKALLDIAVGPPIAMLKEYQNNSEANKTTFPLGWFHTGHIGYLDKDGYLFLIDRIKESIHIGGEKISPSKVDAVLLSLPTVVQAMAFGIVNEQYDEEMNVVVVLQENMMVLLMKII